MAGAILFAGLSETFAIVLQQWSAQHRAFIVETILWQFCSECSEHFAGIATLLATDRFLAAELYSYRYNTSELMLRIMKETTRWCVCTQCDRHGTLKL